MGEFLSGNYPFTVADTILHKYAVYLMASTRCGISAKQIQRETGVTYKTAWRMFKQIRSMLVDDKQSPIGGFGRKVVRSE